MRAAAILSVALSTCAPLAPAADALAASSRELDAIGGELSTRHRSAIDRALRSPSMAEARAEVDRVGACYAPAHGAHRTARDRVLEARDALLVRAPDASRLVDRAEGARLVALAALAMAEACEVRR